MMPTQPAPAPCLEFFVPGRPQPKGRPRIDSRGASVRAFTPHSTVLYEATVRTHALRAMALVHWGRPRESDRFEVWLHLRFADSRRRDVDNVAKAVADALNGVVWVDDFHIVALHVDRVLNSDPGVTVAIARCSEPTP